MDKPKKGNEGYAFSCDGLAREPYPLFTSIVASLSSVFRVRGPRKTHKTDVAHAYTAVEAYTTMTYIILCCTRRPVAVK